MVQDDSESRSVQFQRQIQDLISDFDEHEARGLSYLEMKDLFQLSPAREIRAALERIKVRDAVALYDQMIQLNLGMLKHGK